VQEEDEGYEMRGVFKWIRDKLSVLLDKKDADDEEGKRVYKEFKHEIIQNIKQLIDHDTHETVKLMDQLLNEDHVEVFDFLNSDQNSQLLYFEAFLKLKGEKISETIREYSLQSGKQEEAKYYIQLMKQYVRLCCMLKKEQVIVRIEELVNQRYYPTEELLMIC